MNESLSISPVNGFTLGDYGNTSLPRPTIVYYRPSIKAHITCVQLVDVTNVLIKSIHVAGSVHSLQRQHDQMTRAISFRTTALSHVQSVTFAHLPFPSPAGLSSLRVCMCAFPPPLAFPRLFLPSTSTLILLILLTGAQMACSCSTRADACETTWR